MPTERKLNGVNFHGMLDALARTHGAEARARVEARVEGEAGDALRHRAIVTGGWYPASWYDALLRAVEAELPGKKGVVRELCKRAVMNDFGTLFKVISLVASPEMALRNAMKIVGRYVDGGKISMVSNSPGEMHFKFEEFHGYTSRMWEDFIGGMEGVLTLMKLELLPTKKLSGGDETGRLEVLLRYVQRR